MTWVEVARKDLNDAIRARWLWILSVLTLIAFSAPIVMDQYLDIGRLVVAQYTDDPTEIAVSYSRAVGVTLVPLLTIVMSYAAITRERDSGSIKVLLSLPHSRRDIVLGKFLGRCGAVVIPVAVAILISAVLLVGTGGFDATSYAGFGVFTLLLVVTVAGLGVGLSAHMDTTRRAIFASIAVLVVFLWLWNPVSQFLAGSIVSLFGVEGSSALGYTAQGVAKLLNPFEAYKDLVAPYMMRPTIAQQYPAQSGSAPIVIRAPFAIVVMVAWTVFSLLVGIRHFERVDL
jgi:ABC-2 type transport system permease protein